MFLYVKKLTGNFMSVKLWAVVRQCPLQLHILTGSTVPLQLLPSIYIPLV